MAQSVSAVSSRLRLLLNEHRTQRGRILWAVHDPLLPWAAQGFRIATLTLEPYFAGRNFML
jgi:hypothetical protein